MKLLYAPPELDPDFRTWNVAAGNGFQQKVMTGEDEDKDLLIVLPVGRTRGILVTGKPKNVVVIGGSIDLTLGTQNESIINIFGASGTIHIEGLHLNAAGAKARNEIQTVTVSATAGQFKLKFEGQTTADIAENAAAATVKAALEALSNIGVGDVEVTGGAGGPFTIEFKGALAKKNVAQLEAVAGTVPLSGESAKLTIATTQAGSKGIDIIACGGSTTEPYERVAKVVIQNCLLEGIIGELADPVHPDCIQPQGAVGEFIVHNVTCKSAYQGILLHGATTLPVGSVKISRVNFAFYEGIANGYQLWLHGVEHRFPIELHEVYVDPGATGRTLGGASGLVWPGAGEENEAEEDVGIHTEGEGLIGYYEPWNEIDGAVHQGPPPGGDFVQAADVGDGYETPGYLEEEADTLLDYGWEAGDEPAPSNTGTVTTSGERPVAGTKGAKSTESAYSQWTFADTAIAGQAVYFRRYLELASLPSALVRVMRVLDTDGEDVFSVRVFPTGALQLFDHEGNQQGSTITLDLDKKYRIEVRMVQASRGNGTLTLRVDKEVLDEELSVLLTNTRWNRLRIGLDSTGITVDDGAFADLVMVREALAEDEDAWPEGPLFPAIPANTVPSGYGRRPVGPSGRAQVNNTPISQASDLGGFRFVANRTFNSDRILTAINMEGVKENSNGEDAPDEIRGEEYGGNGRKGYGDGDGGTIRARYFPCLSDGLPDLDNPLAEEIVNAVDRYEESKALFLAMGLDPSKPLQILHFNLPAQLEEDEAYWVLFSNDSEDPEDNYFSLNFPTCSIEAAGPNRLNTLDKFAEGAMGGYDPRECTGWSVHSGEHMVHGERVGGDTEAQGMIPPRDGGHKPGYYSGFSELDPDEKVRLPWYGFMDEDGEITAIQPYYNYLEEIGDGRLVCRKSARAVTLTEAGGYAPTGELVGVVTVTNLATGESGSTAALGTGLVQGELDSPVEVGLGETFTIESDGVVYLEQADSFQRAIFRLGGGDWPFTTTGAESDRAALFALPWPYFAALNDPPPPDPEVEAEQPTALGELLYDALVPLDA